MLTWESFGEGWVTDVAKQLKLKDARVLKAPYGQIADLKAVDWTHDVVFTWNGTTSGVKVPNGDWIAADREGLAICDATSAVFAMDLPWPKLDVVTWSWQKVMGGEGAHGMLVLSPRAVQRLESYSPPWPMPKLFRLTSGGKFSEAIFKGDTINTPSLLCVEDAIDGLRWGESVGGLKALMARSEANLGVLEKFVAERKWIAFLAADKATRSNTSVCLNITAPWFTALAGRQAGGGGQEDGRPAGEREGGLRRRLLPRRAAGPAHLVRRHRGEERSRSAAALARLGLRRDRARVRRKGGSLTQRLRLTLRSAPLAARLEGWATKMCL